MSERQAAGMVNPKFLPVETSRGIVYLAYGTIVNHPKLGPISPQGRSSVVTEINLQAATFKTLNTDYKMLTEIPPELREAR